MATLKLNTPLCAVDYGNVGYGDCVIEMQKFIGALQVPANFEIAQGDLPGIRDYLVAKVHAPMGSRIFPYHYFVGVTDNTEDVTINTTDYGSKQFVKEGFYDWSFRYFKGGIQLHQEIKKNSGGGKSFLFYDENKVLYGYTTGGVLKGFPAEYFYVNPWRPATGGEPANFSLRFIINPVYLNYGNLGFVKLDFNLFDIVGLQDLAIELVSIASNVAVVKLFSKISRVDMWDAYAAAFAQTSAWRATNENGVAVAITGATNNATEHGWNITFNLTAFNAADKVLLYTAIASVLNAVPINVEGFEGKDALVIEAPAS